MDDKYFVITTGEDGTYVYSYTKKELLKEITPDDKLLKNGEEPRYCCSYYDFLTPDEYEKEKDPNYWKEDKTLIIKGRIVVPKPVDIIKRMEIE